ncbi:MAG: S8 family serine peptidase [Alistipes sp.]|nr:S8 family serine peptidase [Alistipes sp.]
MKRVLYIFLFVTLLLVGGCQEGVVDSAINSETNMVEKPYSDGVVLVKFTPEVADIIANCAAAGQITITRSGVPSVDEVLTAIDGYSLERVFPVDSKREELTRQSGLHLWYAVHFDASQHSVAEAANRFSALGQVQKVDVNHTIKRAYNGKVTPLSKERMEKIASTATRGNTSDPLLVNQWHLINNGDLFCKDGVIKSIKGADLQCEGAWEKCMGDESIIVAVLDEGVCIEHPDLKNSIWVNEDEVNGTEDNGYEGDIHGYNFVRNTGTITWNDYLDSGHGSHVAGIIAAECNNGIGVASVAGGDGTKPGVRIMVCQLFSGNRAADIISTTRAIKYAADNGAVVLQCSWGYVSGTANAYDWGTPGFATQQEWEMGSPLEKEALDYFTHNAGSPNGVLEGGIAVYASGNENAPSAGYPGAAPEYISVAATAADFTPAVYTNYGTGVTISAPGGDQDYYYEYVDETHKYGEVGCILSTVPYHISESGYGYMEGTSMATPCVSGVVALGLSYAKELRRHFTAKEFRDLIYSTATPIDSYITGKKEYRRYVADVGPIQPMTMNMNDYKGKMGYGQANATALLAAIEAGAGAPMLFPNIYVAVNGVSAVSPTLYFVGGESLTYTVTIADTTIATCSESEGKLLFQGLKNGVTTATISASNGTKQEFNITVRKTASGNGWL